LKKKKLLTLVGSICLSLVLAALLLPACAPAAPEEEVAELEAELAAKDAEITGLEGDIDDLEDEVSDLEKEITALKKPVKVLEWEPSTWSPAGMVWDDLCFMCDYINEASDGRIVATPSSPGAVCPVEEQLDAVAIGTTEAMNMYPGYYAGKVPITFIQANGAAGPTTPGELRDMFEFWEDGRIWEIQQEEYANYGDIVLVKNHYRIADMIMNSNVPLYGVDDVEGVMFRTSELTAEALAYLGAATVWCPGGEIYTMLATGAVDACTYSCPATDIAMSFHEVTKYWVTKPLCLGPGANAFVVNGTVWNGLGDDLQAIVKSAVDAGSMRDILTADTANVRASKFAADYGIEFIEWSDEDCITFAEANRACLGPYYADPAAAETLDIMERWMIDMGYWLE